MPLSPAISDLEQLKQHPAIARLQAWNPQVVEGAQFDRDEMSIYIERSSIREACALLRDDSACPFNFLSDVTCVDWYPSEPRFEVIYHLLSIPQKERVRLKVRLSGDAPAVESVTSVWLSANFFEREVYDLFGIRFTGHPYLRRIQMPENWEGHPLRKDYPVEGYR
ncbi:MAG TPA: NADH-quinone oxidoreductase subunit C [Terriglobales bacterium]|nr:NADH-quinone oxidoreductase subunit C [Terriglobales bacterium]